MNKRKNTYLKLQMDLYDCKHLEHLSLQVDDTSLRTVAVRDGDDYVIMVKKYGQVEQNILI